MQSFWDRSEKRLDSKGRISIPADVRAALAAEGTNTIAVMRDFKAPFLQAMSPKRQEKLLAQLQRSMGAFDPRRSSIQRLIFGQGAPKQFDAEGRISVSRELLDYAGIDKTMVLVGAGDHLQIWEPGRLAVADLQALSDPEIMAALEALPPEGDAL